MNTSFFTLEKGESPFLHLKKENLLFQAESLTFYIVFTTYLTFSKLKLSDFSKISIKASSSTIKMTKKTKSKQVKKREYELSKRPENESIVWTHCRPRTPFSIATAWERFKIEVK